MKNTLLTLVQIFTSKKPCCAVVCWSSLPLITTIKNLELTIDKSKFGTKSAQAHRKKDIAAYKKMSTHVRQASLKLLEEKRATDDKLRQKNERHIERSGVPYAKVVMR